MSAKGAPADAGFTLLEVVVAVAIAGLALVGLFQAGSGGFLPSTPQRAPRRRFSARSRISPRSDATRRSSKADSHGDDGGGFRWRLLVQPMMHRQAVAADGVTAQNTTLFSVEVAISWQSRGHERAVVLRTLRLGTGANG